MIILLYFMNIYFMMWVSSLSISLVFLILLVAELHSDKGETFLYPGIKWDSLGN